MMTFLEFVNEKMGITNKIPNDIYNFIKNFTLSIKDRGNIIIAYDKVIKKLPLIAAQVILGKINYHTSNKELFLKQDWTPKHDGKYIHDRELLNILETAVRMMIEDGTFVIVRRDANIFKDNAKGYRYDLVYAEYFYKDKSDYWTMGNPKIITKV